MGRQGRRIDARARSATRRAAAAGLLGGLVACVAGGVVPGVAAPAVAAAAATPTTPLAVELDDIVPGELPRSGRVQVTGSVTNADEVAWRQVKLYTFIGADPIDDVAELDEAALAPEDLLVGDRVLDETATDLVEVLEPGESASFSLSVPSRLLLEEAANGAAEPEPGVYWFGVHALGESPEGRDEFTDGRARTFLPLMPEEVASPLPLSLVVPLRTPVSYTADGSVADTGSWAQRLGLGGSLRDRLDFGAAAGSDPVSWLLDPAVVEAVTQLAVANPPRDLSPTDVAPDDGGEDGQGDDAEAPSDDASQEPPTDPDGTDGTEGDLGYSATTVPAPDPADDASAIPSEDPDASEEPGAVPPDTGDTSTTEAAERALAWLDRFRDGTGGDEVLALPYGDVDVAAALEREPRTYLEARRRTSAALRSVLGGNDPVPVVAPPDGFLTAAEIAELDDRDPASLLLGSDEMVQGVAPSLATVEGRPVVLASAGASSGGPGPTEALTSLALRQRILAEAALRLVDADEATAELAATAEAATDDTAVSPDPSAGPGRADTELTGAPEPGPAVEPEPLVVVMPDDWVAQSGRSFFDGLTDAGLELTPLSGAAEQDGVSVRADELVEPPESTPTPLDGGVFSAASALRRSGETLQNLLTRNSRVASVVAGEALTTLGYDWRVDPETARDHARASTGWIRERLEAVTVDAPPGITLSGGTGDFSATVVNGLDQPVTVGVEAVVDGGITVRTPEPVEIGPDARTTVLIETSDTSPGVHNVELRVVDVDGRALPSSDTVPIRSAQVSNVIWVIIATGVGLLVVAVLLRAVRRVRGRGRSPEVAADGPP
ncbi:DUF6049 family protein [Nocardioides sp. AX2bis]|uniref:DUF6049 family protein n=1 Tax=Nocardioides sp. AX2bis TaxID=2653157 RepID=UPI0012EF0A65|nr:DUF6049 family protein [Nocardioides sp. AX2bis]VXA91844.1 conserved exported hypothetical protein [Nocardioides sp. AX2bis]